MTASTQSATSRRFRVDDLQIDLERQSVKRAGREIELPDLSFRLLAALVQHAPDKVAKDDLIREVWGEVVVSDETLAQRIRLLRQALGEDSQNPRYLTSVRGRGYRLICPVKDLGDNDAERWSIGRWPTLAALIVLVLSGIWIAISERPESDTSLAADSIAVLPFTDLSSADNYQHFADGMQEELLARLTEVPSLQVVSRTTVEKFRNSESDISGIAEQLDADAIIEGSVRIAGNRVRITVQLIDAATDRHLWAENFDRELTVANLFGIQEEVADKIAESLQLEYDKDNAPNTGLLPTNNLQAYDAFLLGRYHTYRQTPYNLELAVTYLEQATTLDPDFAEAYAALGWTYSFLGTTYGLLSPNEAFPQARKAALRALALDSRLADAHALYADILTWYDWDFAAAEREHITTLELNPINVLSYALFLSTQLRHEEAISLIEKSIEANPTDEYVFVNAAWRYLNAGQFDLAIEAAKKAGQHPDAKSALGSIYVATGRFEEAIQVFENDVAIQGRRPTQLSNLARTYFKAGRVDSGRELLAELHALKEQVYLSPMLLATVYFATGDADAGFAMLNEAIDVRSREVIFIRTDRRLDGYRNDPRFQASIQRIGLDGGQKIIE